MRTSSRFMILNYCNFLKKRRDVYVFPFKFLRDAVFLPMRRLCPFFALNLFNSDTNEPDFVGFY